MEALGKYVKVFKLKRRAISYSREWYFYRDNAQVPALWLFSTCDCARLDCSQGDPDDLATFSLDLAQADLFLFPKMETFKRSREEAVRTMAIEHFPTDFRNKRDKKCVRVKGDYVEKKV